MKRTAKTLLAALLLAAPLASIAAPSVTRMGDDRFKGIEIGATQQQVRDALGAPASTTLTNGEVHFVYNYVDTWGMDSVFDVEFDPSDRVVNKSQLRVRD